MDSYDSRYPYEYYEIGAPYAFYGMMNNSGQPATVEQITKYSAVLGNESPNNGQSTSAGNNTRKAAGVGFQYRYVAVVVDKTYSAKSAFITVMFKNNNNGRIEYLTRRYVVASPTACYHDGDESMTAQTTTFHNRQSSSETKTSGITRTSNQNKISGITKQQKQMDKTVGVSGITKISQPHPERVSGITLSTQSSSRPSGITRKK